MKPDVEAYQRLLIRAIEQRNEARARVRKAKDALTEEKERLRYAEAQYAQAERNYSQAVNAAKERGEIE